MTDAPRQADVSVVIPVYSSAGHIAAALESVLTQSVRPAEVIVVDDASPDDSAARARAAYPGVRILARETNGGPAAARNAGVAAATQPWIAFLDGDDVWLPWRLEVQLSAARLAPNVAAWCGKTLSMEDDAPMPGDAVFTRPKYKPIALEMFINSNPIATSTVLLRREAFEAVGGFDEQFRGPEDYDLWMRLAARCPMSQVLHHVSRYRSRTGSLSMDDRTFLPEVLRVLHKAFRRDGALAAYDYLRDAALSNQYWNASWMAFQRGARLRALVFWVRALFHNLSAPQRRQRKWFSLLLRYLFGGR